MLRRWFISTGINRKVDPISPTEMARIVGHTDTSMIHKFYYHPDQARLSEKMKSFSVSGKG